MKINKITKIGITTLFFLLVYLTFQVQATEKWCWTKSMTNEPNFNFNPANGGMNWGYCPKEEKVEAKRVSYHIQLITSSVKDSGTTSSIKMQLVGTHGSSPMREISFSNIEAGTTKDFVYTAEDIGDITKVFIKIVGNSGYRCSQVSVRKWQRTSIFECLRKLEPCQIGGDPMKCQMELIPDGDTPYEITIKSTIEDDSKNKPGILISVIGEKGTSPFKMFSDTGMSTMKKKIHINDVGEIYGYQLKIRDEGKVRVAYILIKNEITEQMKNFDLNNMQFINPGKNFYKYNSNESEISSEETQGLESRWGGSKGTSHAAGSSVSLTAQFDLVQNGGGDLDVSGKEVDDAETDQTIQEFDERINGEFSSNVSGNTVNFGWLNGDAVDNTFNVNDPWGGVMTPVEKMKIINLECNQPLINPTPEQNLFGPAFINGKGNYLNILARCPTNCHRVQGRVESIGIHPESSPICLSAIADYAMSDYGGIISINIFPGLESYPVPSTINPKMGFIEITSKFGVGEKSYTVSKVDNPDLVEKDIRILNHKGEVSSAGRVEMRINGRWGTICAKGNNQLSAKRFCMDLGYKTGKWETPEAESEANDFCRTYRAFDHCGSENYRAHFSGLQCTEKDININTCQKSLATVAECGRSFDAIISCTNADIKAGELIPHFVIKLEQLQKDEFVHIGRLEVYRGTWLPVCEVQFNDEAANVACKQMGYDSGEIYKQASIENFKRPREDTTGFGASEVSCSGKENKIQDCKLKVEDIRCLHDQDVLLRCIGSKGDPSGKSQYQGDQGSPSPGLGKLGILKYRATCTTVGIHQIFRGDPGSVYLVLCPPDCEKFPAPVTGTGIYSPDSSICKAAIHAGVISSHIGGLVAYTRTWGQAKYFGTTKNGITTSSSDGGWVSGFTVSRVNTGWRGMWKIFKQNMGGFYLERRFGNTGDTPHPLASSKSASTGKSVHSSGISRSTSSFSHHYESRPATHFSYRSFLTTSTEVTMKTASTLARYLSASSRLKPVFEWIENDPSHLFSDKPDAAVVLKHNTMKALPKYTFIMQLKMIDFHNGKSYLFSYSGCNGFNVFLTEDGLVFGDPCQETSLVNTNIIIGQNDKTLIYAFYFKNKLKVGLFSEGSNMPIVKTFESIIPIKASQAVGLGRYANAEEGFFNGQIDFCQIYDQEIPFANLQAIIETIFQKPKTSAVQDHYKTVDGRECVSGPMDGPTPDQKGAPIAPPEAQLDFVPEIPVNKRPKHPVEEVKINEYNKQASLNFKQIDDLVPAEDNISKIEKPGEKENIYGTYEHNLDETETIEIDCTTNMNDPRFTGAPGKMFRVKCPSCVGIRSMVFGTAIFHPLSAICKAANHIGVLDQKKPGYIKLQILAGFNVYNGSFGKNDEISGSMGKSGKSFKILPGTSPNVITCETTAKDVPFNSGVLGQIYVVICPKLCGSNPGIIFGSKIYTDNSPICTAALHWGAITNYGGEVEFMIQGSKTAFKGSKGFGIISQDLPIYPRSYMFIGSRSAGTFEYKEDFKGKLMKKWEITTYDKVNNPTSNFWTFTEIRPLVDQIQDRQTLRVIHHGGKIISHTKGQFASFITLKGVEWANGRVQANFMFEDRKECAFLFKYVNQENFYALVFNLEDTAQNIRLMKKISGSYELVQSKYINFILGKWYGLTFNLYFSHITILMQSLHARQKKVIFDVQLDELTRGTIGIATNGNKDFYVGGVQVDKGRESPKLLRNNKRTFGSLNNITLKDRKIFCSVITDPAVFSRCKIPEHFCRFKCGENVDEIENILYYSCIQECIRKVKSDSTEQRKITNEYYMPKVGDFMDYLKPGDTLFRSAKVLTVVSKKEVGKLELSLEYIKENGDSQFTKVLFPSTNIFKCGDKLLRRVDCNKLNSSYS